MAYLVKILDRAKLDLAAIYDRIQAQESDAAFRWFLGIEAATLSLSQFPDRGTAIPGKTPYRQLLYGIHIRHRARAGSGV